MQDRMQAQVTGSGEPLVLVPGGLTGWASWEPHAARLSSERRVVRVQLLAVQYGLEGRPLGPDYGVGTETAALRRTIQGLALGDPIDLVAWSFGALVTLDYALAFPEDVRSLVLIEPPARWLLTPEDRAEPAIAAALATLDQLRGDITEQMLADFLRTAGFASPDTEVRELPQWPRWLPFRQSLRHAPAALAHRDDPERLRRLDVPVLLVKGTGSSAFLHRALARLAERLPRAEVAEWPGGHAPHLASMDPFLARLAQFHAQARTHHS
jgi:pimeloyl-ACP methyl ester carboxylesterase